MDSKSNTFTSLPASDLILLKLRLTQMRLLDLLSDAEETDTLDQYLQVVKNAELESIDAIDSIKSLLATEFTHPDLSKMVTEFKEIRTSLRRVIDYISANRANKD